MKKIEIFKNGEDTGYLGNNQKWWFDESFKDSYEIFDLDGFYSEIYFSHDHVNEDHVDNYFLHISNYVKNITGNELSSVMEAGCAGGWFTKKFQDEGIDIIAIEGSKCGVDATIKKGVDKNKIMHHDLRKDFNLNRKFDIVCCTEVAEHIETPFSSQLVYNLIKHSDLIWFSTENPGGNEAHYHHCNEQPNKFWINIFDFFDYGFIEIPNNLNYSTANRGSHIFYNRKKYKI